MKALIRGDEIIEEPFDKWIEDHLDWLTTPRPNGDGYHMIDGYDPEQHGDLHHKQRTENRTAGKKS